MTAFSVFLSVHPNRFCFISEPRELVWESVRSILHRMLRSTGFIFFNIFNMWNLISNINLIFKIPVPKYVFWGLGTFWGVQQITNFFTILIIFYKFALIRDISGAFICNYQYGISHFSPTRLAWGFLQSGRGIGQGRPGQRPPHILGEVPPEP